MIPIRYNLRSVVERRATSLMTILGVALVAMIFVILFGFIGGLQRTLHNAGAPENWIVMGRAAPDETSSYTNHQQLEILRVLPEIAQSSTGAPLMSPEIFAGVNISRDKRVKEFALLRGVAPIAYQVHRNMRLTEGHWPTRGNGEWVIGQKLHAHNPWLAPGTNFHFGRRNWNIVGIFADNDSARESEIWTDTEDLRVHYKNPDQGANSIHIVLKAGTGDAFQQALKKDGRLLLDAVTEADYYSAQAKVANQLRSLGLIVALALAIGAVFGGMNTMYTAVARRQREIGVLRAVGFTRRDILGSFVIESTILGIAGGVVGSILAILVAQATGLNSRTMNVGVTYFSYHASSSAIFAGVIAAVTIGVMGGLLPAWRAAKVGVLESLRGV